MEYGKEATPAETTSFPQYFDLDSSAHMDNPIEPDIVGTVPVWISGSLYRNGSGVYKMGEDRWKHLFDGFAVLHRWSFDQGKLTFLASILDTDSYKTSLKANRLIGPSFGSNFPDPCQTFFQRLFSKFIPRPPGKSDNTAVNIVEIGDRLFALTETPLINEINADSMTVKSKFNLTNTLAVHTGTAHPLKAKDDSCVYYYATHMNYKQAYNFVRIPTDNGEQDPFSGAKIVATVASRWKMNIGYAHSFGMTENYLVHFELPLTINLPLMLTKDMRGDAATDCMVSHPGYPISIIVVKKKTGQKVPITYLAPHGFVFHFINCYEENDYIVCDVCLFGSSDVVHAAYIDKLKNKDTLKNLGTFTRYVLPLNMDGAEYGKNLVNIPGSAASAILRNGEDMTLDVFPETPFGDSYYFDLPTIHTDYTGLKHQYVYGSTAFQRPPHRLMKFDIVNRSVQEWPCESPHILGEPVFVPRPGATKEDDGVVLCTVLAETTQNSSFLVVLDAESFKEIARASLPPEMKMSLTFHGFFSQKK